MVADNSAKPSGTILGLSNENRGPCSAGRLWILYLARSIRTLCSITWFSTAKGRPHSKGGHQTILAIMTLTTISMQAKAHRHGCSLIQIDDNSGDETYDGSKGPAR